MQVQNNLQCGDFIPFSCPGFESSRHWEQSLWLWTISYYIFAKHSSLSVPIPHSCFSCCSEKPGSSLCSLVIRDNSLFNCDKQRWFKERQWGHQEWKRTAEILPVNEHLLTHIRLCYFLMCGTGLVLLHVPKSYLPIKVLRSLRSGTVMSLS